MSAQSIVVRVFLAGFMATLSTISLADEDVSGISQDVRLDSQVLWASKFDVGNRARIEPRWPQSRVTRS